MMKFSYVILTYGTTVLFWLSYVAVIHVVCCWRLQALHHMLLYPRGDDGWIPGMAKRPQRTPAGNNVSETWKWDMYKKTFFTNVCKQTTQGVRRHKSSAINASHAQQVSPRQFHCYRLFQRAVKEKVEPLFQARRLFQEYCCMGFAKQEMQRLRFLGSPTGQKKLRAELYKHLADAVYDMDSGTNGQPVAGKQTVLPSNFTGGPRNQHEKYQNAMAVTRVCGAPSLFVTMTVNINWEEIKQSMSPGQSPADRHDLISRVFKMKLDALCDDLYKKQVFGELGAQIHVCFAAFLVV